MTARPAAAGEVWKIMLSLVLVLVAWLSFTSILTVPPVYSQTNSLEAVKIGYSGVGIAQDLLKLMERNHVFEKHGLSSQNIYIGSGSLMNQAILGGSLDFTTSDLPAQIQAALAGVDFKIIGVTIDRLDGAMMARKEIRKPEDLRGKRLAISRFGSVSDIITRMVLRHSR